MAKTSDFVIVSNEKSAPEASEHHGDIDWEKTDEEELRERFRGIIPEETVLDQFMAAALPPNGYTILDQFMAAAQGQPGVAFGFRAGVEMLPFIIKFEDGNFYTGENTEPDSFAAVDGNDGDADEDDLAIYPVGVGESKSRSSVSAIVESLLKPELTEDDADAIALSLLGD